MSYCGVFIFQEVEIHPPQKKSSSSSSHKKKPPPTHPSNATSGSPMVTTTTQVPSKPQTRVVPAVTVNASSAENGSQATTATNSTTTTITSTKVEPDAFPSQADSAVQSSVVPPSQPTKVRHDLLLYRVFHLWEMQTNSSSRNLVFCHVKMKLILNVWGFFSFKLGGMFKSIYMKFSLYLAKKLCKF